MNHRRTISAGVLILFAALALSACAAPPTPMPTPAPTATPTPLAPRLSGHSAMEGERHAPDEPFTIDFDQPMDDESVPAIFTLTPISPTPTMNGPIISHNVAMPSC